MAKAVILSYTLNEDKIAILRNVQMNIFVLLLSLLLSSSNYDIR